MGIIRFLLALAVVASHSTPVLGLKMIPGNQAVEEFFIISGFYMSLILRGKYARQKHPVLLFYGNRFLRLYPTFLLCTLLTWCVFFGQYHLLGRAPTNGWLDSYRAMTWAEKSPFIFANWSMVGLDLPWLVHYRIGQGFVWFAQPLVQPLPDGSASGGAFLTLPQAWSVGLEIWFYLLAPFLLRRSWWILIAACAASLLCKGFFEHWMHYPTYFLFPAQCCYFTVGALLHRGYEHFRISEWPRLGGQVGMIVIVACTITYGYFPDPAVRYLFYPIFCVGLPLVFSYSRKSTMDRHLGNLSYPIYMVHFLVKNVLQTSLKITSGNLVALAAVAAAVGIYVCLEIPIDGFRQRLARRGDPVPEPANP